MLLHRCQVHFAHNDSDASFALGCDGLCVIGAPAVRAILAGLEGCRDKHEFSVSVQTLCSARAFSR
jgi:hypothetical protein